MTFLNSQVKELVALAFLVVPTVTYKVLFVLLMHSHHRRHVVHVNVTAHPTAEWTAQQVVEAFPLDEAPQYLLHDRDRSYGTAFRQRVRTLGITEVLSAPCSPWQNPYVERFIGSTRRTYLAPIMLLSEGHLKRIPSRYFDDDHPWRRHLSLDMDCPEARPVQPPTPCMPYLRCGGCLIMMNGRQRDRK